MNVATTTFEMDSNSFVSIASLVHELIHGKPGTYDDSYSMAFMSKEGRFEAGVVFTNYIPDWKRIEINVAAVKKNWLTFGRLIAVMSVPLKLGCEIVVSSTDPENNVVIESMERFGAKTYIHKNGRGFGRDEVYQVILMEDMKQSKFWRKANGR